MIEEGWELRYSIGLLIIIAVTVVLTYAFTTSVVATTAEESFDDLCYVNGYYGFKNIESFPGGFMVTCEEKDLRFPEGLGELNYSG